MEDLDDLRERAKLLADIREIEGESEDWCDIDELRERRELLSRIGLLEGESENWTDLDELRERLDLLSRIQATMKDHASLRREIAELDAKTD